MTTLIKNVVLVDGTGKPPVKADVLLKDDKISAIGSFPRYGADDVIDGMGAFLAPGFIDLSSYIDRNFSAFLDDGGCSLLSQGITSVIVGQGGISLAPLIYGSLDALSDFNGAKKLNVNWNTLADFLNVIAKRKMGVNFGTLVGETTITRDITGRRRRPLTNNEMHIFLLLAARSLDQGALGVSIGPSYGTHYRLFDAQIALLSRLLEKYNAPLVCDLGNDDNTLKNTIKTISKTLRNFAAKIVTLGRKVDGDDNKGYFIVSFGAPRELSGAELLPLWLREKEIADILVALKSAKTREQALKDIIKEKKSNLVVSRAPGKEYLEGKTVKAFAENRNTTIGEGFIELLLSTGLRIGFFAENNAELNPEEAVLHSRALVSSPFPRFLEMIEKGSKMPIERGIEKITALPAMIFGIEGRGVIREGYYADLVLFKDARAQFVFVNGKAAVKNGKIGHIGAGKLITRQKL